MKKNTNIIFPIILCLTVFSVYCHAKIPKITRIPRVKIEMTKIPRVSPGLNGIVRLTWHTELTKWKPIVPHVFEFKPLTPRPTYLFLNGLSKTEIDSITQANNVTYRFLSHGIETRKAYRLACDSIDNLRTRYENLSQEPDSIFQEKFTEIQTSDSILANYIWDHANGSPEEMLMWSCLLCEVYPHVTRRAVMSKPIDFEEITRKRLEYFADTLTFKQIYTDILARMVELNDTPQF